MISLHHVAIEGSNLERTKKFYTNVLRLKPLERLTAKTSKYRQGLWYQLGEQELHIFFRDNLPGNSDRHFALITDEFDAIVHNAQAANVRWEKAPLVGDFRKRAFLYDPDQNRIELISF